MRKIIFHYHLFKNAGTSVDTLLKANFPNRWVTREFSPAPGANLVQVTQWLEQEQNAVAFSSHTALLPPPEISGVDVFPILFVRHPIDRIASAYNFERKQKSDNLGATIARHTTLSGYIDIHLLLGANSQCRNFQIVRFAHLMRNNIGDQATLALQALDILPFVGLVEAFEASIHHLTECLVPHFPDFKPILVSNNVHRDCSLSLDLKLAQIRDEIGQQRYDLLLEANAGDMALFEAVRQRYA